MLVHRWGFIVADFDSHYGYDLDELLYDRSRSWRWFLIRLLGLPSASLFKALLKTEVVDKQPDISAENAESYLRMMMG